VAATREWIREIACLVAGKVGAINNDEILHDTLVSSRSSEIAIVGAGTRIIW